MVNDKLEAVDFHSVRVTVGVAVTGSSSSHAVSVAVMAAAHAATVSHDKYFFNISRYFCARRSAADDCWNQVSFRQVTRGTEADRRTCRSPFPFRGSAAMPHRKIRNIKSLRSS